MVAPYTFNRQHHLLVLFSCQALCKSDSHVFWSPLSCCYDVNDIQSSSAAQITVGELQSAVWLYMLMLLLLCILMNLEVTDTGQLKLQVSFSFVHGMVFLLLSLSLANCMDLWVLLLLLATPGACSIFCGADLCLWGCSSSFVVQTFACVVCTSCFVVQIHGCWVASALFWCRPVFVGLLQLFYGADPWF